MQSIEERPTSALISEDQIAYSTYERMRTEIYAYTFGKINFLQLLDRLEEILGIEPPQPLSKTSQSEHE